MDSLDLALREFADECLKQAGASDVKLAQPENMPRALTGILPGNTRLTFHGLDQARVLVAVESHVSTFELCDPGVYKQAGHWVRKHVGPPAGNAPRTT